MTTIAKFEDIEAWQKSRELVKTVYEVSSHRAFASDFGLRDQIRRATVSVMANIAEGFERGGDKELRQFLALAKGSAGEVKAELYAALDTGLMSGNEFERLYQLATRTSELIGGFMRYLSQSDLKGPKYRSK